MEASAIAAAQTQKHEARLQQEKDKFWEADHGTKLPEGQHVGDDGKPHPGEIPDLKSGAARRP